ncbi:hypothetical protein ACWCP6_25865 [Streptomyces sp. NPDC002004]
MKIRRTPAVSAAVVLAAALAAVVGNLALEHTAEDHIVSAADCRLHHPGHVSADLTATFAGLKGLTGDLGTVHIDAEGVHRDGTDVDVSADLHDVTTGGTTGGGTADVTVPYTELRKRLGDSSGMTVTKDDTGLVLTGTAGSLGLPVTVHTRITHTADSVTVTPTTVAVLGREVPVGTLASMSAAAGLRDRLAPHTVTLHDLPTGSRLTSAAPTQRGLTLGLALAATPKGGGTGAACHAV